MIVVTSMKRIKDGLKHSKSPVMEDVLFFVSMNWSIDKDGFVVYKGVKLSLTVEHLSDTRIITGVPSEKIIEVCYQREIVDIRNKKIDQIIKNEI
jgi:hypothetical protein